MDLDLAATESCSVHVDDGELAKRLDRRPRGDLRGDLHKRLRAGRLRTRDDHRSPRVSVLADAFLERDRAQERNTEAFRSEEHTSELQSLTNLVCRLLLE